MFNNLKPIFILLTFFIMVFIKPSYSDQISFTCSYDINSVDITPPNQLLPMYRTDVYSLKNFYVHPIIGLDEHYEPNRDTKNILSICNKDSSFCYYPICNSSSCYYEANTIDITPPHQLLPFYHRDIR